MVRLWGRQQELRNRQVGSGFCVFAMEGTSRRGTVAIYTFTIRFSLLSLMQVDPVETAPHLKAKGAKKYQSEPVFKWIVIINLAIIAFCLPAFYRFRLAAIAADLPVISSLALKWCLAGFLLMLLKFFVFDRCMLGVAERMIVEEVSGEAREDVKRQFVKQIFDVLFHSGVSVGAVAMFGGTEWFPWVFGGRAECVDIFAAFPSWPSGSHQQMEGFVLFQLGVNLYLMLELTVLKRDYYRKFNFYELLLHHVVTCTLLVFATMNILPVAISILFLHDLSDALRALARLWVLSKWETRFHCASVGLDVVGLAGWVYLRVLAFPGCCINSFYFNYDKLDVFGMRPYYLFIMFLCLLLFSLHNFWTFLLAKSAYKRYQFRLKRAELSQGETQKKE